MAKIKLCGRIVVASAIALGSIHTNALGEEGSLNSAPNLTSSVIIVAGRPNSRELKLANALRNAFVHPDSLTILGDDSASITRFCDPDIPYDILVTSHIGASPPDNKLLLESFPPHGPQPIKLMLGQIRVLFIVDSSNPLDVIQLSDVRKLIGSAATNKAWQEIHEGSFGRMKCFSPALDSPAVTVIKKACMEEWSQVAEFTKQLHIDGFRSDLQVCESTNVIAKNVKAAGRAGLGIIDLPGGLAIDWNGLKRVKLHIGDSTVIDPSVTPTVQNEYPLAETIVLYIHPNVIKDTQKFAELCSSKQAADICSQYGLIAPWHEKEEAAKNRLDVMRSGKGVEICICSSAKIDRLMESIVPSYVEASEAVQVKFQRQTSEEQAVDAFLAGEAEMMIVGGPSSDVSGPLRAQHDQSVGAPSRGALRAQHDQTVVAASTGAPGPARLAGPTGRHDGTVVGAASRAAFDRTASGESDGAPGPARLAGPTGRRLTLGYASLGVLVNAETKLTSLHLDELRQICGGEIKEWPAASGRGPAFKGYGLKGSAGVMGVYKDALMPGGALTPGPSPGTGEGRKMPLRLTRLDDTAAVVAAVARDPAAIGFVDLSQMPESGGAVLVVEIVMPSPPAPLPSRERGEKEFGGLTRPVVVYLSPTAGPAAGRFFDWLEKNVAEERYPGTPSPEEPLSEVGKVARHSPLKDVLAAHGLLPPVREYQSQQELAVNEMDAELALSEVDDVEVADRELENGERQVDRRSTLRVENAARLGEASYRSNAARLGEASYRTNAARLEEASNSSLLFGLMADQQRLVIGGLAACGVMVGAVAWMIHSQRRRAERRRKAAFRTRGPHRRSQTIKIDF